MQVNNLIGSSDTACRVPTNPLTTVIIRRDTALLCPHKKRRYLIIFATNINPLSTQKIFHVRNA